MRIIKEISKKTYTGKNGKTYHYQNYSIVLQNGKRIAIRPTFSKDYAILNAVAELVDNRNK